MSVRHLGAAVACFLIPSGLALPQSTSPEEMALVRQKMVNARERQQAALDLPLIDASRGRPSPAPGSPVRAARSRQFGQPGHPPFVERAVARPVAGMTRFDHGLNPNQAFPVAASDAIVRGLVTAARAGLTDDHTAVYSAFDVRIEDVLKPTDGLSVGATVTALRWGGAVQLPSTLLRVREADETMPIAGGTYVLFLRKYSPDDPAFLLVTGYRLEGGLASALDVLPDTMRFEGVAEDDLLAALRSALP